MGVWLVVYLYYECEEWLCVLILLWPFKCQVVAYSMWWDGRNCVGVSVWLSESCWDDQY